MCMLCCLKSGCWNTENIISCTHQYFSQLLWIFLFVFRQKHRDLRGLQLCRLSDKAWRETWGWRGSPHSTVTPPLSAAVWAFTPLDSAGVKPFHVDRELASCSCCWLRRGSNEQCSVCSCPENKLLSLMWRFMLTSAGRTQETHKTPVSK